ncbi:hypothetical protein ZIOFF_020368 [Zingiber officinale]|uniref:Uncharacterized protein n=1 Tax=Zingiber officinale TaxID=94328 RepID=A0A8J5L7W4_ZINOF|nr:hypothetical protein ZIOFF_020368 [Zingiber officinale]
MVEELATQEKQEVTVYDTGTHVVKILEDRMEGAYYLDEIAVQASVYQSFQENSGNRYRPNHEIGQSSQRTRGESNLQSASAYDEVLAQQCQLLEDCSADALESTINHPGDGVNTTESSTRNAGSSSNGNPRLVIREDNIDSDSMSYEMCHLQIKLQKTEVDHFALPPLLPFALHHSLVEGKQGMPDLQGGGIWVKVTLDQIAEVYENEEKRWKKEAKNLFLFFFGAVKINSHNLVV